MKNKILTISLVIIFVFSLINIPVNIYATEQSGETLKELGILQGDLNGDLLLDQLLKRQDGIVLLSRLLQEEEIASNYKKISSFTDIDDPYYDPYIAWAEDRGLTEGIGNGLFGFNQSLTHQQLLAFLLRALGYEYYGSQYGLVPDKAVELLITDSNGDMGQAATRQFMADTTVNTLRKGRVKYSNITLERSLTLNDDRVNENGEVFDLKEVSIKNGYMVLSFNVPDKKEGSNGDKLLNEIIDKGPDISDISLAIMKTGENAIRNISLTKVLYVPTTGQLVLTFPKIEASESDLIEIRVNRWETKGQAAHEAAHVVQQKDSSLSPEKATEAVNGFFDLFTEVYTETLLFETFDSGTLTTLQTNPLYQENSMNGQNPLYEEGISDDSNTIIEQTNGLSTIQSTVTFGSRVIAPDSASLCTMVYIDGQLQDIMHALDEDSDGDSIEVTITNVDLRGGKELTLYHFYFDEVWKKDQLQTEFSLTVDQSHVIVSAILDAIVKETNPTLVSSKLFIGDMSLLYNHLIQSPAQTQSIHMAVTEVTASSVTGFIEENKQLVEKTFFLKDYSDDYYSEQNANESIQRKFGLDEAVNFLFDKKPIEGIRKRIDKATPLLMVEPGSSGNPITLYIENNKVVAWDEGIDNDCDDAVDDVNVSSLFGDTYIDAITFSSDGSSLRTGRNPQTGKEIQIAAKAVINIENPDGTTLRMNKSELVDAIASNADFDFAEIVTDSDGNAIVITIREEQIYIFVEDVKIGEQTIRAIFTNWDKLTDEDILFLITEATSGEKFMFRQGGFSISARAGRTRSSLGSNETCLGSTVFGETQSLDGLLELSASDIEGAKAVLYVETELTLFNDDKKKPEFRGHVTVLK